MSNYNKMVNYNLSSTSAIGEFYQQPAVDTESLSFLMKNSVIIVDTESEVECKMLPPRKLEEPIDIRFAK